MKNWIRLIAGCTTIILLSATAGIADEKPFVIFVTENTTAKVAVEELVAQEYNLIERDKLRVAGDMDGWTNYQNVEFRQVPRTQARARYAELMELFGLADDDPADRGFTDLLTAAGYEVHRAQSEFDEDPITGVVTAIHEFWGDGTPFTPTGDYKLTQAQVDFLNSADLIIISRNVTINNYAAAGRLNGQVSMNLINQWNGIQVPIIIMPHELAITHEFGGYGWGLSYGFSGSWSTLAAFDRQEITGTDRFVFPDMRPVVRETDAALFSGLNAGAGEPLAVYMDYEQFGILPSLIRKFSNNLNYVYPSNARVLLELDVPSFVVNPVGDIPTQDPVAIEFQRGIPAFSPQSGVPAAERVANPAETRLYLAAGVGNRGVYNLSAAGEQFFLNAVEKYAGAAVGGGPGWVEDPNLGTLYALSSGWAFSPTMNWIHTDNAPWIYHYELGYVYWIGGTLQAGAWFQSVEHGFFHVNEANGGWAMVDGQWIQL